MKPTIKLHLYSGNYAARWDELQRHNSGSQSRNTKATVRLRHGTQERKKEETRKTSEAGDVGRERERKREVMGADTDEYVACKERDDRKISKHHWPRRPASSLFSIFSSFSYWSIHAIYFISLRTKCNIDGGIHRPTPTDDQNLRPLRLECADTYVQWFR